jgi:hypothetical protein
MSSIRSAHAQLHAQRLEQFELRRKSMQKWLVVVAEVKEDTAFGVYSQVSPP